MTLCHLHQNVLIDSDGGAAALYRLEPVSYTRAPARERRDWLHRLDQLFRSLETDFSIWRVAYSESVAETESSAWQLAPYLAVSLDGAAGLGPLASLSQAIDRGARRVEALFGVAGPVTLGRAELDALGAAEAQVFTQIESTLGPLAMRAPAADVDWLIRRAQSRGLAEPTTDPNWQPDALIVDEACEPITDLATLAGGPTVEHVRSVCFESEHGSCHQASLTLGALPEQLAFPGEAELLTLPLEALDFPVDVVIHARVIANRDAVTQVRRRVLDADNAYAEQLASAHGPLSFQAEDDRLAARELAAELAHIPRPPLLRCAISLALGAASEAEISERIDSLRAALGSVSLHRPLGRQAPLIADHALGATGASVRHSEQILTTLQLAALMPIGSEYAGSDGGPLLGHTSGGARRPIRFDSAEAPRENRTPSVLIAGTLGSGKTVCAQQIARSAALAGARVIDIDPKPDHELESLPGLQDAVEVIELSGDSDQEGILDPLRVAPEALREDLTSSYLIELLPAAAPGWETAVRRAVRDALKDRDPSCAKVLDLLLLAGDQDSRDAASALSVWAESGLGRLAFGPASTERRSDARLTTIRTRGLALPGADVPRCDYAQDERLSVATLKLVAAYALGLITGDRAHHKLLVIDEAWFLLSTRDGRRLIEHLNRLGRTENATLVLATQRLSDATEVEALVGTRILFRQETNDEAKAALTLLGLEPDDEAALAALRSYPAGRCLMRDGEGRIAEVQVLAP